MTWQDDYKRGQARFAAWIADQGVKVVELECNGESDHGGHLMRDYVFVLRNTKIRGSGARAMRRFEFHSGIANDEPRLIDLFACLIHDSWDVDNHNSWEEWTANFELTLDDLPYSQVKGYQATWNSMVEQTAKVKQLMPNTDLRAPVLAEMLEEAGL